MTCRAGFGPTSVRQKQKAAAIKDEVSERVALMVKDNAKGLGTQLDQYGYATVDGFLGGSVNGYPDKIHYEMTKLFGRGWFESDSEIDRRFKIGPYTITNDDAANRFRTRLIGVNPGEEKEGALETQYEVAPTVVNLTRSLIVSMAGPAGIWAGGSMSSNIAIGEIVCMAGNGARMDRRVSNSYHWNTQHGVRLDNAKLVAFYFLNPNQREALGGHLQLEGVITPTGAASVIPRHDRLALFWADKTVWSMRRHLATCMSDYMYALKVTMFARDFETVKYDPNALARWFPEMQGRDMGAWPPENLSNLVR